MDGTPEATPLQATTASGVRAKTLLGQAPVRAGLVDGDAVYPVDARTILKHVRDRVQLAADAKDVDVVVHCSCSPVWLDAASFSTALYELVDNAVRATRRGHPVFIDVRDTVDADVLWQIQDAGDGIAEADLRRLGRPPHPSWTGPRDRGIALAWAVIEEHHGVLHFESSRGVGTMASVWLPGARERELIRRGRR